MEQKRSSKTAVSVVAGVLVVAAVVALSYSAGFTKANSVVNSNYARKDVAKVEDDVKILFDATCADWETTRFTMAVFNADNSAIVPAVQIGATTHWERDFEAFKNALPDTGVAFSVYNFPVWTDENTYEVIPTFVTYRADPNDIREKYRGGSFLGSVAVAAKCTGRNMVAVTMASTYLSVCEQLADTDKCTAVNNEECPFKQFDGEGEPILGNPCAQEACSEVTNFAVGEFGEPCCDVIDTWCALNMGQDGCNDYSLSVYEDHCGGAYNLVDVQKKLLEGFEDEDDLCLSECASPCTTFDSEPETFAKCSGCGTDGQKYDYGTAEEPNIFAANCFPGQYKFQEERCCGVRDSYAECKKYDDNDTCESMPDITFGCTWETHKDCGALVAAAAAEDEALEKEAAAAAAAEEAEKAAAAEEAEKAELAAAEEAEKAELAAAEAAAAE